MDKFFLEGDAIAPIASLQLPCGLIKHYRC